MKKLTMVIIAAAFVSLVGCAKDWTCTCTESMSSTTVMTNGGASTTNPSNTTTTITTKYDKVKKKNVSDKCASMTDVDVTKNGTTSTTTTTTTDDCKLEK